MTFFEARRRFLTSRCLPTNILVAHASLGAVLVLGSQGEPVARIASCRGRTVTNVTFGGADQRSTFITESETGAVLRADWTSAGIGGAACAAR